MPTPGTERWSPAPEDGRESDWEALGPAAKQKPLESEAAAVGGTTKILAKINLMTYKIYNFSKKANKSLTWSVKKGLLQLFYTIYQCGRKIPAPTSRFQLSPK
jgi:hypothetical protein